MSYSDEIKIDINMLDKELAMQPSLFLHYAEDQASKRKELDICIEELDVMKADIGEEFSNGFNKKPTEAGINRAVTQDSRVQEKERECIQCKYEFDLLSAAVRAFDQRKGALENLVRLYGMNYWADPSVNVDQGAINDIVQERVYRAQRAHAKPIN